jgi:putative ABC transport system ATP-binding protein
MPSWHWTVPVKTALTDKTASVALLQIQNLSKRYPLPSGGSSTPVFSGVHMSMAAGEFVALLGESGVGKSTLLNCIAGLDTVSGGRIELSGTDIHALPEGPQAHFRRAHLGFVFQAFHVLPHLTVAQNVALPLLLLKRPNAQRVTHMLEAVGLRDAALRLPQTLSGGQLQRVALARALVHQPRLILADEPTGNLDPGTAERVMDLLREQVRSSGAACLLVTHSQAAAARADRVLTLTATGVVPSPPQTS